MGPRPQRRLPADIRSPAGQAHEVHTEKCWEVLKLHFGVTTTLQKLHDTHPADGIIRSTVDGRPMRLIEVKSRRDFDEEFFWRVHNGTWLISNHKIEHNVPIAKEMQVPFMGAMHIIESRVILLKTIWANGALAPGIKVRKCETQASINGGRKVIDNAFIPMHDALRIKY